MFNPLDKSNLAESIAKALLSSEFLPLPPNKFKGAGIYMIFYSGDFELYRPIVEKENKAVMYVGSAVPVGARKGLVDLDVLNSDKLYSRLKKHSKSIKLSNNLSIADFSCKYLVIDDIWIPLAERLIIQKFRPVWNHPIDGFGNNAPGAERASSKLSNWDTIHSSGGRYLGNFQEKQDFDIDYIRSEINNTVIHLTNDKQ